MISLNGLHSMLRTFIGLVAYRLAWLLISINKTPETIFCFRCNAPEILLVVICVSTMQCSAVVVKSSISVAQFLLWFKIEQLRCTVPIIAYISILGRVLETIVFDNLLTVKRAFFICDIIIRIFYLIHERLIGASLLNDLWIFIAWNSWVNVMLMLLPHAN